MHPRCAGRSNPPGGLRPIRSCPRGLFRLDGPEVCPPNDRPDVPGTLWIAHRIPEILDYVPEIHEPSNWSEPRLQGPTNKEADTIGLIARLPDKSAGLTLET